MVLYKERRAARHVLQLLARGVDPSHGCASYTSCNKFGSLKVGNRKLRVVLEYQLQNRVENLAHISTRCSGLLQGEEGQSIWLKRRQGFQPCFEAGIRELPFLMPEPAEKPSLQSQARLPIANHQFNTYTLAYFQCNNTAYTVAVGVCVRQTGLDAHPLGWVGGVCRAILTLNMVILLSNSAPCVACKYIPLNVLQR